MNRGELRSAVDRRTGVYHSAEALNDYIDDALGVLSLEADWPWLIASSTTTLTADETPALPARLRAVESVVVDGYPYEPVTLLEIDTWDTQAHGYVRVYATDATTLHLRPTPTGGESLTLRYVANEAPLEEDTATPLLPAEHHGALVALAAARVLDRGEPKRAAAQMNMYATWRDRMLRTAAHPKRTGRIRVRSGVGI